MEEKSRFLGVSVNEILGSGINAAFAAVIFSLASVVGPDFNIFTADWVIVGQVTANAAFIAFVTSLSKRLMSVEGKVFGVIKA
jgi:hypothetical protein